MLVAPATPAILQSFRVYFEIHGGTRTILFYFAHHSEDQRLDTKTILRIKLRQIVKDLLRRITRLKQDRHRHRMRSRRLLVLLISNSLAFCELYLACADMGPNPVCAQDH